jgi:hypothetical protein
MFGGVGMSMGITRATAAKGRFPYPHRTVAEWCRRCHASRAGECHIEDCPWHLPLIPKSRAAEYSPRGAVLAGTELAPGPGGVK